MVTCSNILWIKEELRRSRAPTEVDMSTDINSLLGAMAIGKKYKFAPFASLRRFMDVDDGQ